MKNVAKYGTQKSRASLAMAQLIPESSRVQRAILTEIGSAIAFRRKCVDGGPAAWCIVGKSKRGSALR